MNLYETRPYLNEYLLLHYGRPRDKCAFPFVPRDALRFHERLVADCLLPIRFPHPTRGLDIGCAVGRPTFELAQRVDRVIGVDNARLLIQGARRMARAGQARIERQELGAATSELVVALPPRLRRDNVTFKVGDAQALREQPAHVVMAINLTCRLPQPRKFLAQLPDLVLPGGQLLLASPHTWLERYTPRRRWLTAADLRELLAPAFRLRRRCDRPFLIRETPRKYQWVVSDVMTFERR